MIRNEQRDRSSPILLGLSLLGLAVYVLIVLRFPIETYIRVPRSNIGSLTRRSPSIAFLMACAGITLYGSYVAAILLCWRSSASATLRRMVWVYGLASGTVLILVWPITSTDIFDYIFRGRMAAHYGANPYIVLPNMFKTDPLFAYLGWPNAPSAYGPLWEMLSARMAAIGGTSLWTNVLLHKGLALATFLVCGLVIARLARDVGPRAELVGSALWLLSPLAIWEITAIGHNDGLLILSMLLAIWAVSKERYGWATAALVVGGLLKFLPLILLPLVAMHGLRHYPSWPARLRLVATMATISIGLLVLAYVPYWEGPLTLRNITLREKFLNAAPLSVATYTLSQRWHIDSVRPIISRIGSALLATGIAWQMWHIWSERRDVRTAFFGLLTWYLIVASQWFQPWYVLWLLALLAVRPSRREFAWVGVWAFSAQTSYLLQFFVLNWLGWRGNELRGQLLYLIIIFLPLLIAWSITHRRIPSPAIEPNLAPS